MGIFDRLFHRKGQAPTFSGGQSFSRTWSTAPRAETVRLPDLFHKSPRLDAVALIAETISSCPLVLYDREDLKKNGTEARALTDHPALLLLETPSARYPEMDGRALVNLISTFIDLLGEAFLVKFRSGRRVDELMFMPPGWCTRVPTKASPAFQFIPYGATAGVGFEVAPEDVVWFKKSDIADPYNRGRGRTEAMGDELDSDEMAAKFQKNFFYNDGTPPLLINIPGADQATVDRFRDSWSGKVSGWLNARKPAITGGDTAVTVTKLNDTVKEMDFTASRLALRDAFLQHYSIPPELMGILTNSNRSTIDSAYYLFGKNVIQSRIDFIGRVLTSQLIRPDFDERLCLRFDFEIPEDEAFRLQKANDGVSRGMLTRAEWRKAMGYKVGKNDNVYIVPSTLLEVPEGTSIQDAKPVPPAPIIQTPEEPGEDTGDDEAGGQGDIENPGKLEKPKGIIKILFKSATPEKIKAWTDFDTKAKEGEPGFILAVKAYAKKQRARMGDIEPTDAGIDAAIDRAFTGADKALVSALTPAWIDSMTDGYKLAKGILAGKKKSGISFDIINREFIRWVMSKGLEQAKNINKTTNEKLKKMMQAEIALGVENGDSMDTIAEALKGSADAVYFELSNSRAELIARTETMGSVNFGQLETYSAEGVEMLEWLPTIDNDTRADHLEMVDKTVKVGESFTVGGESMQYPGDPNGGAGQVCNCRCTILPIIKGVTDGE